MTIKEQQLEAAKTELGGVFITHRSCYTSIMALRQLYKEREEAFKINLTNHPAGNPLELGQALSHTFTTMRGSSEFLNLKAALDYAEALPETTAALEIVSPIVARIRELEAAILSEREAANRAAHALQEAEEAARAAAELKLAKDPLVIAARKALEAAQPALVPDIEITPFRGKVKLEEAALV